MSSFLLIGAASNAESVAGAAQEASGLPQMDVATFPSQLFWLAASFGFLYLLFSGLVLPRLGAAIGGRRDRIADDLDQAAEFRRQAQDAERRYAAALGEAKARARALAGETRDKVAAELAELQKDADARAIAAIGAAEVRISAMKQDAAQKVRDAAGDTTRALVEALINETPTADQIAEALSAARNSGRIVS